MIEVATAKGRVAYGPVTPADVPSLFDAMASEWPASTRGSVSTEEIPWLKRQTRLTFARCGVIDPRSLEDYRAHDGYKGLERALTLTSDAIVDRRHGFGIARPRRRGLSDRHQMEDGGADEAPTANTSSAMPMKATAAPSPTA